MQEEIKKYVGKKAIYHADKSLSFEVVIKDVKKAYGRNLYLVVPVKGQGQKWVETINLISANK